MILTKKSVYIVTLATCLGLGLFGFLVVAPYVQDIFSLSNDIKKQKSDIKSYDLKEENFKKIKNNEKEVNSILNNLSEALVSKENSLEFIILLEEIASKTSNTQAIEVVNKTEDINNNKRGEKKDPEIEILKDSLENVEALYFKIRLQGTHKNLLSYLAELESLSIYTDVMSLKINSSGANSVSGSKPFEEEIPSDIINTTLEVRAFAE